jgi:4-amino-4-deoxy-L-arabinose transferase-like glycosyltransferase
VPTITLERAALPLIVLGALAARIGAVVFLAHQTDSTYTDYMIMASSVISTGHMRDSFGNVAFYSPGYPMFLIPFFEVFGVSPFVGTIVNAGLGGLSVYLAYVLARQVLRSERWALAAAAAVAVYPILILYAANFAKENLMIPLLLVQTILLIRFPEARRKLLAALVLGIIFGLELLTGPAVLFTGAVIAAAFVGFAWLPREFLQKDILRRGAFALVLFGLGCLVMVGPWLAYTKSELGAPVLTTNSGFNLYLGNNPAATGYFVGIQDTPIGPEWNSIRERMGEVEAMSYLKSAAITYIVEHPGRAAVMTLKKIAYFWAPPLPDPTASKAERLFRLAWLACYAVIVPLALVPLLQIRRLRAEQFAVYGTVLLYCLCVVITHVTARYRLPVMPFMAILAVDGARRILESVSAYRTHRSAAETTVARAGGEDGIRTHEGR